MSARWPPPLASRPRTYNQRMLAGDLIPNKGARPKEELRAVARAMREGGGGVNPLGFGPQSVASLFLMC